VAARDPDAFVREITRRIAVKRQAAGLTQESAAQRYCTALKNWQRFEAGQNITLHTLARIAHAIGTTPEELVAGGGKGAQPAARAGSKKAKKGRPAQAIALTPQKRKTGAKKAVARRSAGRLRSKGPARTAAATD